MKHNPLVEYLRLASISSQKHSLKVLWQWLCELPGAYGACILCQMDQDGYQYQMSGLIHDNGSVAFEHADLLSLDETQSIICLDHLRFTPGYSSIYVLRPEDSNHLFLQLPSWTSSALALPLLQDGKCRHWVLLLSRAPANFSGVDRTQALLLVNLFFSYRRHHHDQKKFDDVNRWIGNELSSMVTIQQALHPDETLNLSGVDVAVLYRTFKYVGGDYYDLLDLSGYLTHCYPYYKGSLSAWGVIIGDVSGHGPGAALEAAMLDAILRTFRGDFETSASEVIGYLNQHFFTRKNRGNIVTLFTANFDPISCIMRYACAGHPHPIIKRNNGVIDILDQSQDIPLGVLRDYQWEILQTSFHPGDLLLLYTDGITEALDLKGEEFGFQRLLDIVGSHLGSAQQLLDAVDDALQCHQGEMGLQDDQTMLAIMNCAD